MPTEAHHAQAKRFRQYRLGSIVRLKKPYKPDIVHGNVPQYRTMQKALTGCDPHTDNLTERMNARESLQEWAGWTHGIIVEELGPQWNPRFGPTISRFGLHLYDPERAVIYMGPNGIPTVVDFHLRNLLPYHVQKTGYQSEDGADADVLEAFPSE